MCALYGWTPDYVLNHLSWPEVVAYLKHGREAERTRATIWINRLAEAFTPGDHTSSAPCEGGGKPPTDDGPDVATIERLYGPRIVRRTAEDLTVTELERATGLKVRRGKA